VKSHGCSILDKLGLQSRNLWLGLVRQEAFLWKCSLRDAVRLDCAQSQQGRALG